MDGFGGYHTYIRDVPDRFETEADDQLMESMYKNYATEGMTNGLPNGHFWVSKADGMRAAEEVSHTHLNQKLNKSEFEDKWNRYDVNEAGKIEIDMMPVFLRAICGNAEGCIGL
jgi:hypothetical protein